MSRPRVVILTGASHSGKTSVARALLPRLGPRSTAIAIDDIVGSLYIGEEWPWEEGLPIAYEVAAATLDVALGHGFTVLYESTFTYVPVDGSAPTLFRDELTRIAAIARGHDAQLHVVELRAGLGVVKARRAATGRLSDDLIEQIWELFDSRGVAPPSATRIEAGEASPVELAEAVLGATGAAGVRASV